MAGKPRIATRSKSSQGGRRQSRHRLRALGTDLWNNLRKDHVEQFFNIRTALYDLRPTRQKGEFAGRNSLANSFALREISQRA